MMHRISGYQAKYASWSFKQETENLQPLENARIQLGIFVL